MTQTLQIAIDGPIAAGKSTVSRLVANELEILYIDTGAMYRMGALLSLQAGLLDNNFEKNENKITNLIKSADMDMRNPNSKEKEDGRLITVFLNNHDVSWKIRSEKIGNGASKIAILPKVRKTLVKKQQKIANNKDVVMEGRDITHKVLPEAQIKIYLKADVEIRAKRKLQYLLRKGIKTNYAEVYQSIEERDHREKTRKIDPLQIVDDAWVIDSTNLEILDVVSLIINRAQEFISY